MVTRGLAVLIVLLVASSAGAEDLKNPDVPFGPLAADLFINRSFDAEIIVPDSEITGNLQVTEVGVGFLIPLGPVATFQIGISRFTQSSDLLGTKLAGYEGITFGARLRLYGPSR